VGIIDNEEATKVGGSYQKKEKDPRNFCDANAVGAGNVFD